MSPKIASSVDSFRIFNGTVSSSYATSNVFWDRRMNDNEQYRMSNIRYEIVTLWGTVTNILSPDRTILVSFARVVDTGFVKKILHDIVHWDPKRHRIISR